MDDFRRRPVNRAAVPVEQPVVAPPEPVTPSIIHQPIEDIPAPSVKPPKKKWKKGLIWGAVSLFAVVLVIIIGGWFWYSSQLAAVDASDTSKKLVAIESGSTPTQIAATLKEEGIIRNETVFLWYTRINGVQNNLQAGSYRLSPSETTPEVVEHLSNGNVDAFQLTFLPGTTLKQQKEVIVNAGYSEQEVEAAFAKTYTSPLFEGKPTSADLEGYIFPETYNFGTDTSVEAILEHVFEEFYSVVQENDLIAAYKAQGLSLFEGITMASIIQKEAVGGDERQIAQVFLTRHSIGMALGSDPTYQYITDKLGVPRDINYDSPYNTRRYPGIPPGPIANSGVTVLRAVGNPAEGDYLYFLSGDDDVTYFSRTFEEHEANIRDHCQIKCQAI